MTHQDLKEAAMKATEAHAAYKADNAFQNELAWHDAEARFRLVATRSRILSLIEDNERMREALAADNATLRLYMGELSAQEIRAVRAAFNWVLARAALKEKPHD